MTASINTWVLHTVQMQATKKLQQLGKKQKLLLIIVKKRCGITMKREEKNSGCGGKAG
jgi:hypothetical protein